MHKYFMLAAIVVCLNLNGALPGARHTRTLTKEDAAKLAQLLGVDTVAKFQMSMCASDAQKKAAEEFISATCPFVAVAQKGALTVPSKKKPSTIKPSQASGPAYSFGQNAQSSKK